MAKKSILKRSKSTKWLIGIGLIAIAVVAMTMTQISSNTVYFYTPDEAQAKATELSSQNIKVAGMVLAGSKEWQSDTLSLAFTITDLKNHEIRIKYHGAPPDLFKEGQGVVVEGTIAADGKSMAARTLMVKHSEEYKKPGEHSGSMSKELLEKSLFKGEATEKPSTPPTDGGYPK
jgi:cytochrome c-type biogenesis protein CcmE